MIDKLLDVRWWRQRIQHRLVHPIHKHVYPTYDGAIDVMSEDWDLLVILDGCRSDLFKQRADMSVFDSYQTVESVGSDSQEWIQRTFTDGLYGDIVYVTANPHVSKLVPDSFHSIIDVWTNGFDDQLKTIPPETVKEAAVESFTQYPNKRVIVHFMQPHHPFIGTDIPQYGVPGQWANSTERNDPRHVWDVLREGHISKEAVWEAYGDNLSGVLEHTVELVERFDGKVVVTADHGNALGERAWPIPLRVFGHPGGIRLPALTHVPWATIEAESRRTVRDDGVYSADDHDDALVEDRLADLGYLSNSEA